MSLFDEQQDGSCRNTVGVWGDRSCPELREHVHCRNCPVYARIGRSVLERDAAAAYLGEWQSRIATEEAAVATDQRSLVVFRVQGEWLALPTRLLREIVEPLAAHQVPHRRDPRFGGLVNVRGELIPGLRLGPLLGAREPTATNPRAWARTLIVERDGAPWALPVDEVDGVHRIPEAELRTPPVTVGAGSPSFTAAVFTSARGDVGLLDDELLLHAARDFCR